MLRTTVRTRISAPNGAMRFQNGSAGSSLSSCGVRDQTSPRSWASVFLDVVARDMTIVAAKQTDQAKIAVQKFCAMLLG